MMELGELCLDGGDDLVGVVELLGDVVFLAEVFQGGHDAGVELLVGFGQLLDLLVFEFD